MENVEEKDIEVKRTKDLSSRIRWLHEHHFVLIMLIVNAVNFILPLVWVTISIYMAYSPLDSIIGWILLGVALVFFLFGMFLHIRDKNILFNVGLLLGFVPLYIALSFWTIYHAILAAGNIIAILVLIRANKGRNKLRPRFKTLMGKLAVPFLILIMIFPVGFYLLLPNFRIPVIVEDNSAKNLEINWMWAEIWELDQDVVDSLEYCNNLENINVSVMVGLPEDMMLSDLYTSFIINETTKLTDAGITWDFMPLLPLDMDNDPDTEDYGYDGLYINDITIDRYLGTIEIFKWWVSENNLSDAFRVICIDTELYWAKRNELYFQWWQSYDRHSEGADKLEAAIDSMKDVEGDHPVVSATFGMHLDDFVDFDDAQLQMMQMSAFPPWNWDGVGVMIYETGFGSDYSIYSSCNAMKYYLGDAAIPYIITAEGDPQDPKDEDLEHIETKFKIIKNMGFEYTGAWALTDFLYYFEDYSERDDKYEKARVPGGERFSLKQFRSLHREINDHKGDIKIYYQTLQHSAIHFALQYVDVWLFNFRIVYDGNWPKIKELPKI